MVKKMLLSLALVVALVPFTLAQRVPSNLAQHELSRPQPPVLSQHVVSHDTDTAPSYCKPCLAYGGDFDPNDPNANGLANWNTVVAGEAEVWVPFVVPAGKTATVTGMFVNTLATIGVIDPATTPWSIQARIKPGTPGKIIASGTATATINPTGRNGFGLNEYTVLVKLDKGVTLKGDGQTAYWFDLVPQCTNGSDNNCNAGAIYYESDTEAVRANHGGLSEPNDLSYFNSAFFGVTYLNTDPQSGGCNGIGCDRFSMGLLGKVNQ